MKQVYISYLERKTSEVTFLTIPVSEYYDILSEEEKYAEDGIPKFTEPNEFIGKDRNELEWLKVSDLQSTTTYRYGIGGSIFSHAIYSDGDEQQIIQTFLCNQEVHTVKLIKKYGAQWIPFEITIINDKADEMVKSLL
jgi:hypothetical protein